MADDTLATLLGRMEQSIEDIKNDIKEIKEEQKGLVTYVNTQKIGLKLVLAFLTSLGAIFVYFKDHLSVLLFGKIPH